MKRRVASELLDDDLGTPPEIASSLRDLRHINDWFGGTQTTIALLRRVAQKSGQTQLSLLEIGAGLGDVPLTAQRVLATEGIMLRVALLDRVWSHLPKCRVPSVSGDAMRLPFGDDSFDIVSSSLFAHHFEPEAVPLLLQEALRVCRRAVLVNDLIRSPLHLLLVYLGLPLFRSRITWHDAPASVRRAYTIAEMKSMLAQLTAARIDVSEHYLFRMGIVLWK